MAGSTPSPAEKAEAKPPETVQIVCGPDPVFVTDYGPLYPAVGNPGDDDYEPAEPVEVPLTDAIQELLDSKAVVKHTAKPTTAKKESN